MPTLEFKGKQHIYAHHLTVPYRPLVADPAKSLNPTAADDNLIIHGDNLHALKALLPRYAGRVKCIYIDPPYNTGNEGWRYNDKVNSPLMQAWLQANGPVDNEDLERHDKWLCMLWPRLHLLRELLADDGVIFVSIDDNEQHHLRMLMDEIFGENCFIASIAVKSNPGGRDYGGIAKTHDYVLAYGNGADSALEMIGVDEASLPMRDDFGGFELRELRNRNIRFNSENRPNLYYPFYVNPAVTDDNGLNPVSVDPVRGWMEVYPIESRGVKTVWRWQKSTVSENIHNVGARPNRNGGVHIMEKFRRTGKRERSILDATEYRNEQGTVVLKALLDGNTAFDYPKSPDLIKRLIELGTSSDSIILDSFAGSGTTAHAVLALNKADGGNRRFILVECEDYADAITAERVRRVINGVPNARDKALQGGLGGSFAYCTLGAPIDPEKMLTGEELPAWSALAAYLLHTAAGLSAAGELTPQDGDGLFYATDTTAWHLLYQPTVDWLRSPAAVLTEEQARRIAAGGKAAYVFAADKYIGQRALTDLNITFCQLPYELHRRGW